MTSTTQLSNQATVKSVLFVENDKTTRDSVTVGLEQEGFHAIGVENRRGMRELFKKPHRNIDVMILDANLEDKESHATGFDVGQEVIDAQPDLPPRRIVYTGHGKGYLEAAMKMGADAYIRKLDPNGQQLLYSNVRTSSLIRALSPVRPEISGKIGEIAERNFDVGVSAKHICQEVIAPEVSVCLGVSCLFLYTDRKSARILNPETRKVFNLPADWRDIQNRIFHDEAVSSPYALSTSDLTSLMEKPEAGFAGELKGSIFIPIYDEGDFRLSMGILPAPNQGVLDQHKDPQRYAENLYSNIREPIAKEFKYLHQVKATMERTKLRHTSTFCLYVSRTQIDALEQSLENEEITSDNRCFRRLKRLANDLEATGIEFSRMIDSHKPSKQAKPVSVSAQKVVREAWNRLIEQGVADPERLKINHEGADVQVPIEHEDLFVATLRMLEWLAQREDKIGPDAASRSIDISYERQASRVAIRFTDHSWQLGERLRKRLFEPFTQGTTTPVEAEEKGEPRPGLYLPLYLAKVLLTVKNGGSLEDRTYELKNEKFGNRFVFSFPVEDT